MIIRPFRTFEFDQKAIYLVNNTMYTQFDRLIKEVPSNIKIFVNQTMKHRYERVLSGRDYVVIDTKHVYSFRSLLKTLTTGKAALVAVDVDQSIFQAVGRIAQHLKTNILPVYAHGKTAYAKEPIRPDEDTKMLNAIQSFLLDSYLGDAKPGEINLFNELLRASNYYGNERVICKDITGEITYKELILNAYVLSERLSNSLQLDEQSVGVFLPNSIGNAVTVFSLFYLNKSPVMLNYSAGLQTILDACETAHITTILTSREFIAKGQLEDVEEGLKSHYRLVYMEDVRKTISLSHKVRGYMSFLRKKKAPSANRGLILFTSGSEHKPRGIVLTHHNIFSNIQQTRSVIDFGITDKMLNAMPMFHSFGLSAGAILPVISGIQTYLYPSPLHYKRIPELAGEQGSTILFGTSSFLEKYGQFARPEDFQTLRYAVVGAERLKAEVEQYWLNKFNLQIMQGYGATETSPIMCLDTPLNHKQGSVGRFLPGIEYLLEPVEGIETGGKLLIQAPNLMKGYLTYGQGYTPQHGWYDTGDVVNVDENGFVTIIGRLKRFSKIAGEMVSLNLIEQLASQCFTSTNFAAMSVNDATRGERIILVTTDRDVSIAPLASLIKKRGYSKLYVPSEVRVIDDFPLLGSGKIDYVALKQQVS